MPTAVYTPPPDKSITLRALLLAAVAEGRTTIKNPLLCGDTSAALACLAALGVKYSLRKNKITLEGRGLRGLAPRRALNAGASGTLCRLLAGILAGQAFPSVLNGSGSLRGRPMDRVARPLGLMGAKIKTRRGRLPLAIKPSPLKGIDYCLPVASAQVKSALLLAGLYAEGRTIIKEPSPSRDHTERLLEYFGAGLTRRGRVITLKPGSLKGRGLCVPGDISSAAPFLAAALLCGRGLLIKDTGLNPTRLGLVRVLKRMGARIKLTVKRRF
ncbi:MAG: 3-phosphoshikimate 1-carboxyvinyltransferase, partial [Elusimicrobia bacterium CG08_land_8_20_14_0_20_59_10]